MRQMIYHTKNSSIVISKHTNIVRLTSCKNLICFLTGDLAKEVSILINFRPRGRGGHLPEK